ncbi:glycosyltransferase [Cerasicoccus maritimus]|uniref:glycosyltransferase n=1 Tax=Cerasicoccus maritimus TaxID=490089 RepID=UPI0028529C42|nr:glycosyltransferase [Cerasicoccus maritimus]
MDNGLCLRALTSADSNVGIVKALLISGQCPYNIHQRNSLREAGVDAEIFEDWGIHLSDHLDAILAHAPDVVHLQWPESICRHRDLPEEQILKEFATTLPKFREAGIAVFWTMHNLLPHDRGKETFWREVYLLFAQHCDVCCHHSEWGKQRVLETYHFPHASHVVLRHGYFHEDIFPSAPKEEARQRLNLPDDASVFLNVGAIRPDKQIAELLDAFTGRTNEVLVLAGAASGQYAAQQIERASTMDNVIIHAGYTDDETVCLLANAADCFLFMQGDCHLTSGAPHLSQAHQLPQITLDYPYAREVLGDAAIYIPANNQRFEKLGQLLDSLNREQLAHCREMILQRRRLWHWSVIAAETKQAYEDAVRQVKSKSART